MVQLIPILFAIMQKNYSVDTYALSRWSLSKIKKTPGKVWEPQVNLLSF
jgi:hypothetical protein